MLVYEYFLLLRRQLDHAVLVIGVKCREDPVVDAKVRMAHVRAFNGVFHPQCDSAKVFGTHMFLVPS